MSKIRRSLLLMFLCFVPPTLAWAQTLPAGDSGIMKPGILIVEDYKGPDGSGDQGGFVLVTFLHTPQHAQLAQYRVWREILVSFSVDEHGRITIPREPRVQWVPWAVIEAKPVLRVQSLPYTRAVIPTIDNVATRWAITAEMGNKSAGDDDNVNEEYYVKESLALLGVQSAMRQPELEKIIDPAYEFMQALLGDQKDFLLGTLDLDGLRRVARRIPEGVRAQLANIRASDATLAATAVRAIDNIPPAAVSDLKAEVNGRQVTLTWTVSRDDRVVGLIPYRGYAVPIAGVRTYNVLRNVDGKTFMKVASLAAGTTRFSDFVDENLGNQVIYRIDPVDLDNATPSGFITVVLGDGKSLVAPATVAAMTQIPKTPTEFALRQNFPNPFNPATTIKYDLAEGSQVELLIYNIHGQVVRTLVAGPQAAGRYTMQWDGKDESGNKVSSGMYFYRLITEKFQSVKKLMLLK